MEISSVSGMQVGMNFSSMYKTSGSDSEDFAEEMSSNFLSENDTDGDGLVSAAECSESEDFFNSIDEDGDGYLSQEELLSDAKAKVAEMQENFSSGAMGGMATPTPSSSDTDDTTAEATEQQESGSDSGSSSSSSDDLTDEIDTNGDGVISQEELLAYLQSTMGTMVADAASETQSSNDGQQLLEQTSASSDSLSGVRGRAADAYGAMQQSMFGESQDASSYAYAQSTQEGLSLTV